MFITYLHEKNLPSPKCCQTGEEIRLCSVCHGHSLREAKLTLGKSCLKKLHPSSVVATALEEEPQVCNCSRLTKELDRN